MKKKKYEKTYYHLWGVKFNRSLLLDPRKNRAFQIECLGTMGTHRTRRNVDVIRGWLLAFSSAYRSAGSKFQALSDAPHSASSDARKGYQEPLLRRATPLSLGRRNRPDVSSPVSDF